MVTYGRVARSYTRPERGNLRAALRPCSSTRPPLWTGGKLERIV